MSSGYVRADGMDGAGAGILGLTNQISQAGKIAQGAVLGTLTPARRCGCSGRIVVRMGGVRYEITEVA